MRGTRRLSNQALAEPVLMFGAERPLVMVTTAFWSWAFFGVFPHWPSAVVLIGWVVTLYVLKLLARHDAQGCAVFKSNSRFLLQQHFYSGTGLPIEQGTKPVESVPIPRIKRLF